MTRTFDNVTAGNVTAAIVARKMGTLDDNIFNGRRKERKRTHNEIEKVYNRTDRVSCHFPWSLCSINKVFCNKNDHSNR